jgi:hypothetical protein
MIGHFFGFVSPPTNRCFKFEESSQLFICVNHEAFSFIAMCVSNPYYSSVAGDRSNAAASPTAISEVIRDDLPVFHAENCAFFTLHKAIPN